MRDPLDDKVSGEAERWFARRLEPAVRESERAAFEHWHDGNPAHAQAFASTERLWETLSVLKQSERLRAAVPPPDERRFRRLLHPAFLAFAASIAVVAIGAFFWLDRAVPAQTFTTALGEQRTETLADGTILRLNTHSTLDVQITKTGRLITLREGEATFDVARDASRPFVVAAGDGTVTAIGTHFQVRHEAGSVSVALIEGRVQLARPARREVETLAPGQQATFSEDSSGIVRRNVDLAMLTRWTSGRIEFRGTPLVQAVAEANRYSARKIRIGDPAIESLPVSGTFRTGDVDGMTTAFEAAFPVRAQRGEDEVVLYRP